jgi:hypothetical protein
MATNEVVEPNPCVELNGLTLMEFPEKEDILTSEMVIEKDGLKKLPIQKFIERVKELNLPYFIIEISLGGGFVSLDKSVPDEYQKLRGLYLIKECKKNFIKCDFYPFDINNTDYLKKTGDVGFNGINTMRFNSSKCEKDIVFKPSCIKEIKKDKNLYVNYYVAIDKYKMDVFYDDVIVDGSTLRNYYRFNSNTLRDIMYDKIPLDIDIKNYSAWKGEPLKNDTCIGVLYTELLEVKKHNNEFYNKLMNDKNTNINMFIILMDNMIGRIFPELGDYYNEFAMEQARKSNSSYIEYYNEKKNRIFNHLFKLKARGIDTFLFLDWMIEIKGYKRENINKDYREQYPDHLTVSDFVLKIINEYRALIDTYHNNIFKQITNDILVR